MGKVLIVSYIAYCIFKSAGYVEVPLVGNTVDVLVYPICSIKCRGQMVGHRFKGGAVRPDSLNFRQLFPTLHCQLICGGTLVSQYSRTVSISFLLKGIRFVIVVCRLFLLCEQLTWRKRKKIGRKSTVFQKRFWTCP